MDLKTPTAIIGIVVSLTGTPLLYDSLTLTDSEIQEIRDETPFTLQEDYIYKAVVENKEITVDMSSVNMKEVTALYIEVLKKLDDDFKGKEYNMAKRMRNISIEKTSFISNLIQ